MAENNSPREILEVLIVEMKDGSKDWNRHSPIE
jgi:hypothetical protein